MEMLNDSSAHQVPRPTLAMRRAGLRCPEYLVTHGIVSEMMAHAVAAYPAEACGIVKWSGDYIRCVNLHPDPLNYFRFDEAAIINAAIIVHSHPDRTHSPSSDDMRQQQATALAWGIVPVRRDGERPVALMPMFWGDPWPVQPLMGRPFVHGIYDCYSIIRDWYALDRHVDLPDFPRDAAWWETADRSMYEDNFPKAGFEALPYGAAPERGDVFFAHIRSRTPNHGGIFLGEGMLLHHLQNRLSRTEPAARWVASKIITRWVRWHGG